MQLVFCRMAQESCKEAEETIRAPEAPILCINNCGFFGNPMTESMCSKCYRDTVKSKTVATVVEKKTVVASSPKPLVAEIKDEEASASVKDGKQVLEEEPPKPPSNRCLSCRKKARIRCHWMTF